MSEDRSQKSAVGGQRSEVRLPTSDLCLPTSVFPEGEPVEITGNKPLYAVDKKAFWMVTRGEANVFGVRMEDGKVAGPRTHLFQAAEGDLILGACHHGSDYDLGFMVTGKPGTEVNRLDRGILARAFGSEDFSETLLSAIKAWITRLSRIIGQDSPPPGNYLDLEANSTVLATSGEIIRTHADMIWIQLIAGDATLAGDPALPLSSSHPFPLTRGLWVKTHEVAQISAVSSRELPGKEGFDETIARFHQTVFQAIMREEGTKQTRDRKDFERRISQDHLRLENAFFRLGAMLFRKKKAGLASSRSDSSLFSAATAVAKACGIETNRLSDAPAQKSGDLHLEDIARAGNFFTRQVILIPGWSGEDNGPLLGRLGDEKSGHYVALLPISPRRYELLDPEEGTRIPMTRDMEDRIHAIAHSFYRPLPPKALTILDIMRFTLTGVWKDLGLTLLVGAAGALLALLIPIMTGVIIDSVIPDANRGELLQIGLILMVSVFATFMFHITRAIALVRMEGRMDAGLQAAVIDRLLALPTPFFRQFTAGDLANRTMGINQIRRILSGATLTTAMTAVFSSFNLIVMFIYDWKLALIGLGMMLLTLLISGGLSIAMVRYQRQIFQIQGKNAGIVLQLLTGIAKLRMTGTEDRAFGVWAESFSKKKAIDFKSGKINALLDTITSFVPMVSTMLIFWFFLEFRMSQLSTGHFLAFNSAFSMFQAALIQTTLVFANLLHIIPLWERAKPILTTIPEVDDAKTAVPYLSGNLMVDHVSFRYSEKGPLILKDVNFEVASGEFVALVGGSGSGKSTLLRILLGFEKPESGSVYYDRQDLADLDVKSVRRQMGVVLQKGQVMPGSILKNITGAMNLTPDDAWAAARMVGLEEDIEAMPMGMHTVVSAGGGTLSGGQRQRLIIARAIVRRPRILFFDEATSALDNRAQAVVSESIEKLNVTRVVIAHRLSTILNADRIYVMEHGEIKESGTYETLMQNKGAFYELAKRQIA